jgi:Uma2 family endonuclease
MLSEETQLHRLTVEDVYSMVDAGVLQEEDRVELIDGVLVDMTPPGAAHSSAVAWLTARFVSAVDDHEVRVQDLLLVEGGFVIPDLMVIDPLPRDRHPSSAVLVIEVSVTTQRHDKWKAERYARAGVGEYWIVDLPARAVTVHRAAAADGYGDVTPRRDGDRLQPAFGGPELDVTALLGPPA